MKKSIIYLAISATLTFSGCDYLDDMPYDLSLIHISEPTRLGMISYAVFCLKKKKQNNKLIKNKKKKNRQEQT